MSQCVHGLSIHRTQFVCTALLMCLYSVTMHFPRVDQNFFEELNCAEVLYRFMHMGTDLNRLQITSNRKLCSEVKLKVIQLTSN